MKYKKLGFALLFSLVSCSRPNPIEFAEYTNAKGIHYKIPYDCFSNPYQNPNDSGLFSFEHTSLLLSISKYDNQTGTYECHSSYGKNVQIELFSVEEPSVIVGEYKPDSTNNWQTKNKKEFIERPTEYMGVNSATSEGFALSRFHTGFGTVAADGRIYVTPISSSSNTGYYYCGSPPKYDNGGGVMCSIIFQQKGVYVVVWGYFDNLHASPQQMAQIAHQLVSKWIL